MCVCIERPAVQLLVPMCVMPAHDVTVRLLLWLLYVRLDRHRDRGWVAAAVDAGNADEHTILCQIWLEERWSDCVDAIAFESCQK